MFELIAFCLINGAAFADGTECAEPVVLPACQTEDGANCFWDAATQGNHQGQSFVDVDGTYYTWTKPAPKWTLLFTVWHASAPADVAVMDYGLSGEDCIFAAESMMQFAARNVIISCEMEQEQ